MRGLPANPLSIELSITNSALWWQAGDDDDVLEHWEVSADVWDYEACSPRHRHVGGMSLVVADLDRDRNLLDEIEPEQGPLEYIAESVIDLADGVLVPELDTCITPGVPRMVIIRWFELAPEWRGHGLAGPLIAAALDRFARTARLAVCRIAPSCLPIGSVDPVAAEFACTRLSDLLESVGFFHWKGVHVVDLNDPTLRDASLGLVRQWAPDRLVRQRTPDEGVAVY
ncbi:N-acetyltransferase [Phytoactinopolyspora halotolerans]|uniref:N-acetyltransferase n=1 Tax=Phytoactinopolyspora halotolerans TaxID=1981512 RepID=A0A6L9SFS3_9ACTN|nr:N-acetyltransferase [Phytoactinopolyspora halotolerans]NEE03927.1 N-acetyltransferase [Phytoactinopolyspora halotolerans]